MTPEEMLDEYETEFGNLPDSLVLTKRARESLKYFDNKMKYVIELREVLEKTPEQMLDEMYLRKCDANPDYHGQCTLQALLELK